MTTAKWMRCALAGFGTVAIVACVTLRDGDGAQIVLARAVHFHTADGSDASLTSGTYLIRPSGNQAIIFASPDSDKALTVAAEQGTHDEVIELPTATTLVQDEDLYHVVLLLPRGKTLAALGSFSGVWPRGQLMAPPPPQISAALSMRPLVPQAPLPGITQKLAQQPLLTVDQLRPVPQTAPQLNECAQVAAAGGLPIDLKAVATGPFSVQLDWSAPPGDYEVVGTGDGGVFRSVYQQQALQQLTVQQQTQRPALQQQLLSSRIMHEPALPQTRYEYILRATFKDGRKGCGQAVAQTPGAPMPAGLRGTYNDPRNIALSVTLPPYTRDAKIYRTDPERGDSVVLEIKKPSGERMAGRDPQWLPEVRIAQPGLPPMPYSRDRSRYQPQQLTYDFIVETAWQESPSGPRRTSRVALQVPGPQPIFGYADLHNHQFAYLGFGGNPLDFPVGRHFVGRAFGPMGMALQDCTAQHGPGGVFDIASLILKEVSGVGHHVGGVWQGSPNFDGWPRWDSATHQAVYEDWLKRAVDSGLRLMVVQAVNNEWLCATLNSLPHWKLSGMLVTGVLTGGVALPAWLNDTIRESMLVRDPQCRDIDSTENQLNEAFAMQAWIDMRAGGPGKGWYRVVKTPQEARQVISQGKLAVVLGIEVDNLFGCDINSQGCTQDFVRAILNQYYAQRGVRHVFPIHFYDNAFGGSANSNVLIQKRLRNPSPKRACPYQADGGQCNARGLTPLGKFLIREMMARGMIIDVDHMSELSFNDAMNIVKPAAYPVVSSHTGFTELNDGDQHNEGQRTPQQIKDILGVGGMFAVIPHQGALAEVHTRDTRNLLQQPAIAHTCGNSSETFTQAYLYAVEKTGYGPVGFGTDFNSMGQLPGPRRGPDACPGGKTANYLPKTLLNYSVPISVAGRQMPITKSVVGLKTFDLNDDGLAHMGMLPDLIADMQALGVRAPQLEPLFNSAEGYIRLWERAHYLSGQ